MFEITFVGFIQGDKCLDIGLFKVMVHGIIIMSAISMKAVKEIFIIKQYCFVEGKNGLDPQSRILVRDFIRQLAKKKTVILTTHDMDEADRLSDRVAVIDHGKILLIDTPENLKTKSGSGDILQIRVNGINDKIASKILNSMPHEFTEKKYSDGFIFLGAVGLLELVPKVNTVLNTYDMHIEDMTIRKRTLEDAFIAMTGRGLRE